MGMDLIICRFFTCPTAVGEKSNVLTPPKSLAYANFATGAYYFSLFNIKSSISIIILYMISANLSSRNSR